jgi:Cytochrome b(N-terminal)/b6/petB
VIADLNGPGHYFQWSILTISVANLIVVAVMLLVFLLAIVLPFSKGERVTGEDPDVASTELDSAQPVGWTGRLRKAWLRVLPPGKLLPDTQPAYVSSWVYVFGVASLAALVVVIASGVWLAFGGVDWWHRSSLGHFVNSLHMWSVELFMAFMVIHLWGKFWMAAWRGGRAKTWITGVLAFFASVLEAFTGYLSQQNFDSQWIATNGKDAINSTGVGGSFNLLDFGQMLLWHVVLVPIILISLIVGHVLMVRAKGVVQPIALGQAAGADESGSARRKARRASDAATWRGPKRRYDIVKEGVIATVIALVATFVLAGVFSSPDDPPVTIQAWAQAQPGDFVGTALAELGGTSTTAGYGPPYNSSGSSVQTVFVSWQQLAGVHINIDPPNDFVLKPLSKVAPVDQSLADALAMYKSAAADQQQKWISAYNDALGKANVNGTELSVAGSGFGPVDVLMSSELKSAQSGALDTDLISNEGFYGTDFTKPLLFLEDGTYYASVAQDKHLTGTQWGVTNETGSYPGQPWLWLYQLWYQIGPIGSSHNVDLIAIYLTLLATVLLMLVPFIPGIRDLPRWIPIHRAIWRRYKTEPPTND